MSYFQSLPEQIKAYAMTLGSLRARCAPDRVDTYSVALGQLLGHGLIEQQTYDEAMALRDESS